MIKNTFDKDYYIKTKAEVEESIKKYFLIGKQHKVLC